jgi:hypothetical protein
MEADSLEISLAAFLPAIYVRVGMVRVTDLDGKGISMTRFTSNTTSANRALSLYRSTQATD